MNDDRLERKKLAMRRKRAASIMPIAVQEAQAETVRVLKKKVKRTKVARSEPAPAQVAQVDEDEDEEPPAKTKNIYETLSREEREAVDWYIDKRYPKAKHGEVNE